MSKVIIKPKSLRGIDPTPYTDYSALSKMLKNIGTASPIPTIGRRIASPIYNAPFFKSPAIQDTGGQQDSEIQKRILESIEIQNSILVLKRGLSGISISIGTTPVRVVNSQFLRGYIFANPTVATGKASTGVLLASAARPAGGSGDSTIIPLDVSDYKEMRLYLDITLNAGANTVQIGGLTKDSLSGNWAISQSDIFVSPASVGTYYENIGTLGVDDQFAINWGVTNVGGGNTTFSVSYLMKDSSSAFSLSNTIYLGGAGVTPTSGYPLLEGKELKFFLDSNVELWAVSNVAAGLDLKIFELQ